MGVLIRLARRTYLRYSKRISKESIYRYRFKNYKKYDTYLRKYKDYNLISISLISYKSPINLFLK
jgi:hypothetical protein